MTSMMIKGKSSEFVLNENKVFGEWSCYISNLLESSKKKQNTKKWSICSSSEDLCSNVRLRIEYTCITLVFILAFLL